MNFKRLPKDPPIAMYSVITSIVPSSILNGLRTFFFSISPDVPYDLGNRLKNNNYWKPIIYGVMIGWILCFFTPAAFSYFENVLLPPPSGAEESVNGSIKYFLVDKVNLVMYIVITPATFALGLAMLLATFKTWYYLDEVAGKTRSSMIGWKGFIVATLILVAASVAISNYINDIMNPQSLLGGIANNYNYWFLGSPERSETIKPITVYYTILNFLILAFTLSCVAIFITAARPIINLSKAISGLHLEAKENQQKVLDRLSAFADVYTFAKLLLLVTMLHSIVWSYSPLAETANFNVERGFIAFVSVFFITIPRYHFVLSWYKVAVQYRENGIDIELKPDDINNVKTYLIWVADVLLVGSYGLTITGLLEFGPYGS